MRDAERLDAPALHLQLGDMTEAGNDVQDRLALAFLDDQLAQGPDDCWIACHWPLFHTVMGDPRIHFTSAMEGFHAKPDRDIRAILARHPNARLWVSGHTHSPLSAPGRRCT